MSPNPPQHENVVTIVMPDPKHYDPRMGDESGDETPPPSRHRPHHRHVRLDEHPTLEEYDTGKERRSPSQQSSETTKKADSTKSQKSFGAWILATSPVDLQWIPNSWSWSKIKPLIRCAIVAWISVLFFVVWKLEVLLGQVCPKFLHR